MREKGRVDVHQIESAAREISLVPTDPAGSQHAVLGIDRQIARGDAQEFKGFGCAVTVLRRDQGDLVALADKFPRKGLD